MYLSSNSRRRRARLSAGGFILSTLALAWSPTAFAQEEERGDTLDQIIVVADPTDLGPTEMAPDAAALLSVAGELGDPLKAILVLPSITFAGGDFEAPVIRGGGPEDNLYFVDDIPVTHVLHELSDSIISDRVIRTFDLHAGAAPAQFGVGGVVTIGLRDPREERRIAVDLSQFRSGFMVEGPVAGNVSGYIHFRENLGRILLTHFEEETDYVTQRLPESRDLTARLMWRGDRTSVTATALGAFDRIEDEQLDGIPFPARSFDTMEMTGFGALALRVEHAFESGAQFRTTLSRGRDRRAWAGPLTRKTSITVDTTALRSLYETAFGDTDVGLGVNVRRDEPQFRVVGYNIPADPDMTSVDGFVTATFPLGSRTEIEAGLSILNDQSVGETAFDPRVGLTYDLGHGRSLFARAGITHQRPRLDGLLSHWGPLSALDLDSSQELSVGYRRIMGEDWRAQAEVFVKNVEVTDFRLGPNPVQLDGEIYGLDLLISKSVQQGLYGFLALSLSENTRSLPGGTSFDAEYSAPLSATLAVNYQFEERWNVGAKYRMQSGQVYTPATVDTSGPVPQLVFGERFSERSDIYHRLDVRAERELDWDFADASIYVDILNLLGSENPSNETPVGFVFDNQGNRVPAMEVDTGVPQFVAFGLRFEF